MIICENSSVAVSDLIPHILKVTNAIPTDLIKNCSAFCNDRESANIVFVLRRLKFHSLSSEYTTVGILVTRQSLNSITCTRFRE